MVKYTYMIGGKEVSYEEYEQFQHASQRKLRNGGYVPTRRTLSRREHCSVMDAHDERYRKWYHEPPPPVIEDYRCAEAKKSWPGYARVLTPHGWKEGPRRFKDKAEQSLYERTYGFKQVTGTKTNEARSLKESKS